MNEPTSNPATLVDSGDPVELGCYLSDSQQKSFMETVEASCCSNCIFWLEYEPPCWNRVAFELSGRAYVDYDGECRRHAPMLVPDACGEEPLSACHPEVRYSHWCGDFEAAD